MKIERRTRNSRVEGQSPTKTLQPPSLRAMKRKWAPLGHPKVPGFGWQSGKVPCDSLHSGGTAPSGRSFLSLREGVSET